MNFEEIITYLKQNPKIAFKVFLGILFAFLILVSKIFRWLIGIVIVLILFYLAFRFLIIPILPDLLQLLRSIN